LFSFFNSRAWSLDALAPPWRNDVSIYIYIRDNPKATELPDAACLWRIVISAMIPQDSRPATILRCAIFSFFSSTFIYIEVERAPTWTEGGHSSKNLLKSCSYNGRVAQLREHLLCKRGVKFAKSCRSRRKPLKSKHCKPFFLRFVRFLFGIYGDLSQVSLRFYYGANLHPGHRIKTRA
jgi:hypothetical protein